MGSLTLRGNQDREVPFEPGKPLSPELLSGFHRWRKIDFELEAYFGASEGMLRAVVYGHIIRWSRQNRIGLSDRHLIDLQGWRLDVNPDGSVWIDFSIYNGEYEIGITFNLVGKQLEGGAKSLEAVHIEDRLGVCGCPMVVV